MRAEIARRASTREKLVVAISACLSAAVLVVAAFRFSFPNWVIESELARRRIALISLTMARAPLFLAAVFRHRRAR